MRTPFLRYTSPQIFYLIQLILVTCLLASPPIKVAVIGDSITWGVGAEVRKNNRYSSRLGHLLGDGYETQTFAASSLCMLRDADLPFTKTKLFSIKISAPSSSTLMEDSTMG